MTIMSPWWSKSSSKEAKKKPNGDGIFGLIRRKLKKRSESKQISSPLNPAAQSQNFTERSHTHPLSGDHVQNGHDQTEVEAHIETDSKFTDGDRYDHSDIRLISPQASNYETGDETPTDSPSSFTFVTQKKWEKLKPVEACVSNKTVQKSPKRHPLNRQMANLQTPQSGGPESSMFSPRSPMRVFGPEPLGPGSSPGSGQKLSHNLVSPRSGGGSGWKKGRAIGQGLFGDVYLAFNSERGEMCVMKEVTLFSDDPMSKESAKQLGQEISLLRHLRHPNIVRYYGSEIVDDKLCIYLEYVGGGSIFKLLQEYGGFSEATIRSYTRQILSGLKYLHSKNTVHMDIKGANILVDPNGCVKLADFGMAKHISGPAFSLSVKASEHWMAPEIINSNPSGCNLVVDIWSLGCTVVEMATAKPPWSRYESVAALLKVGNRAVTEVIPNHLSNDGKDFIFRCMQWDPSLRPSAVQLLDHPFVKKVASPQRLMPPVTNASIGHASKGVLIPHNISCPVSHMGSPLLHSRTGVNLNKSTPRTILGSPTRTPTGAAAAGPVSFHDQSQNLYSSQQILRDHINQCLLTNKKPNKYPVFGRKDWL